MADDRKWALITGATGGLGRAFGQALARRGYNLVLTAREADVLEAMAAELSRHGGQVVVEVADLAEPDACLRLKQALDARGLIVETLVANAGYGVQGRFVSRPRDAELGMVDVNVRALTDLSHLFGSDMAERGGGGHILLVASTAAFQPIPGYAVYAASKAYVLAFGQALHRELARRKVVVSVTCPGPTQTPFWDRAGHRLNRMASAVLMTPEAVVETSLNSLYAGRPSVVPGIANKLITLLTRLFPRSLLAWGASVFMSNAK